MTLGDNPGGSSLVGPPVTLAWEKEGSERYLSVDAFVQHYHGTAEDPASRRPVQVLTGSQRTAIAARNHTQATIAKMVAQVKQVRRWRDRSAQDDAEAALEREEHAERLCRETKQQCGPRRLFRRRGKWI